MRRVSVTRSLLVMLLAALISGIGVRRVEAAAAAAACGIDFVGDVMVWVFNVTGPSGTTYTVGVSAATEAEALAILNAPSTGTMVGNVFMMGEAGATEASATTLTGIGLGTAATVAIILVACVVIATGIVLAIDYYSNDQSVITLLNQVGWGNVLLGWGSCAAASPNTTNVNGHGYITVNCSDPTPLADQCRVPVGRVVTDYGSIFTWTCADIWSHNITTGNYMSFCNNLVSQCVQDTMATCAANNIPRNDPAPVFVQLQAAAQ